jgi:cobalt-precorrin-5B (C1)-methyltransferase
MLLTGGHRRISISTPKGIALTCGVLDCRRSAGCVRCAVRIDSGDDPDVTNGVLVYASVCKIRAGIEMTAATVWDA